MALQGRAEEGISTSLRTQQLLASWLACLFTNNLVLESATFDLLDKPFVPH